MPVPISRSAAGHATLNHKRPYTQRFPADAADAVNFAHIRDGGTQGCGGATALCVGGYHECLCVVQRLHYDTDFACTADDTYVGGSLATELDGAWG